MKQLPVSLAALRVCAKWGILQHSVLGKIWTGWGNTEKYTFITVIPQSDIKWTLMFWKKKHPIVKNLLNALTAAHSFYKHGQAVKENIHAGSFLKL